MKYKIDILCKALNLGTPRSPAIRCQGGRTHQSWRIDTDTGSYIIKQLNTPDIHAIESSEQIARTIHQTTTLALIPAIQPVDSTSPIIMLEKNAYLVFPYIASHPLNTITPQHSAQIGRYLATLHTLRLPVTARDDVGLVAADITAIALPHHDRLTQQLTQQAPWLHTLYQTCQRYTDIFKQHCVISHRDLDPNNVLWRDACTPVVIDWETAGTINQTRDLLTTALYWSFNPDYTVDHARFIAFIESYLTTGGVIEVNDIEAGLYGMTADWLNWLNECLQRLLSAPPNSAEAILCAREATRTLTALPQLVAQFINLCSYDVFASTTKIG